MRLSRLTVLQVIIVAASLLFPNSKHSTAQLSSQGTQPSTGAAAESDPILDNLTDLQWTPMVPQMGKNSPTMAIVHEHPQIHSRQFLIRMPPNFHVPAHFHSANETHTVIEGAFIMEVNNKKVVLKQGGFNYTPARMVHEAWTPPEQGALIFVTIDGPYDLLQK